jgi:hypothetical protein
VQESRLINLVSLTREKKKEKRGKFEMGQKKKKKKEENLRCDRY